MDLHFSENPRLDQGRRPGFQVILGKMPTTDYRSMMRADAVRTREISLRIVGQGFPVSREKACISLAHSDEIWIERSMHFRSN